MAQARAALLVDRVLPSVPVRQYVLAFPYELSGLAATKPEVLRALARIFWESVRLRYRRWAKTAGLSSVARAVETGAVTATQRFGSSLNVHVHFHMLVLDGVYILEDSAKGEDASLRFEEAPAPTRDELQAVVEHVYARVMKWLARRGLLRSDDTEAPDAPSPAEALTLFGMHGHNSPFAVEPCRRSRQQLQSNPRTTYETHYNEDGVVADTTNGTGARTQFFHDELGHAIKSSSSSSSSSSGSTAFPPKPADECSPFKRNNDTCPPGKECHLVRDHWGCVYLSDSVLARGAPMSPSAEATFLEHHE